MQITSLSLAMDYPEDELKNIALDLSESVYNTPINYLDCIQEEINKLELVQEALEIINELNSIGQI